MNDYASIRKPKQFRSGLVILVVVLLVLQLCSASVLFSQISAYSTVQNKYYISLTEGSADGTVEISQRDEAKAGGLAYRPTENLAPGVLSTPAQAGIARLSSGDTEDPNGDKTGFKVYDENTVWSTHTDVEIFSVRYDDNGDGHYTTASSKGDKVFAPGTTQSYTFTLANTGTKSLDYKLTILAYYENTDGLWIPIEGRLSKEGSTWLIGSATEWPDVLELDGYKETGVLAAKHENDYTIDWRWPFERFDGEGLDANDEYDTMLGNTAVDKDLILHIIIMTEAWLDENPDEPGGHPTTGDSSQPYLWASIFFVSLVVLLLVVYALYQDGKKKRDGRA